MANLRVHLNLPGDDLSRLLAADKPFELKGEYQTTEGVANECKRW